MGRNDMCMTNVDVDTISANTNCLYLVTDNTLQWQCTVLYCIVLDIGTKTENILRIIQLAFSFNSQLLCGVGEEGWQDLKLLLFITFRQEILHK